MKTTKQNKMMHARALVTDTDKNGYARIVMDRKNSCGGCGTANRDACRSCLSGSKLQVQATVVNGKQAQKGDIVTVSLSSATLMKGAFVLYLIPVAGIMIGALLGFSLHPLFPVGETAASIFFGLVGLMIGFTGARIFSDRMNADDGITPVITRINFSAARNNSLMQDIAGPAGNENTCPGCG